MGAIEIADYDPAWPATYDAERAALLGAVGGALVGIEHVGSTAVPGLAAKPTIDILAGVKALADADRCVAPMQALGYEYVVEYEAQLPDRRYFRRPNGTGRGFHVHMVEHGSPFWERLLLFRDYLRTHPKHALHYQQLKLVLAARCGEDRAAYTRGKSGFVGVIEELARSERP